VPASDFLVVEIPRLSISNLWVTWSTSDMQSKFEICLLQLLMQVGHHGCQFFVPQSGGNENKLSN